MRIGLHTSVAGSLEGAAVQAYAAGANTLQIFTSSPRMWRGSRLDPADVKAFQTSREKLGLDPLVVHNNYLTNLASADPRIRANSIRAYREELVRSMAVGADYLVAHPGASKGHTIDRAIDTLVKATGKAARGLRSQRLVLLWEITAGQGSTLGSRVEELQRIARGTAAVVDFEIGYCVDTAHVFAAGLDFFETVEALGYGSVHVIHANDSKAPFGSHVDRHEHIGRGYIGRKAFHRILTHPKLCEKAFILETPVEQEGDDRRNIAMLRRLCRKSRTTTAR